MSGAGIRQRFTVNGLPANPNNQHAALTKIGMVLLEECRQRLARMDGGGALQQITDQRTLEDGSSVAVSAGIRGEEVIIDVPYVPPKPEGKDESGAYLWVGFRVKTETDVLGVVRPGYQAYLIAGVWEPYDKMKDKPRGIVCTHPVLTFSETAEAASSAGGISGPDYAATNNGNVPEQVRPLWWQTIKTDPDGERQTLQVTPDGGLYMAATEWGTDALPDALYEEIFEKSGPGVWNRKIGYSYYGPFDPLMSQKEQLDFEIGPRWFATAVLDPAAYQIPSDARAFLNTPKMFGDLGVAPRVFPGNYAIKVGSPTDCLQTIVVEIEVRVGKSPNTVTEKFDVTILRGNSFYMATHPYGFMPPAGEEGIPGPDGYTRQEGPNPHAKNWWPGAILVDVAGNSIKKVDYYVPEHGFSPEAWWLNNCASTDVDIYVGSHWPDSLPWADTLPDAFGLSVINWPLINAWQAPQTLPPSSGTPAIQQAILVKSAAAGVELGRLYHWGRPQTGLDGPSESFTDTGIAIDPVNLDWLEAVAARTSAKNTPDNPIIFNYAVIIIIGVFNRQMPT